MQKIQGRCNKAIVFTDKLEPVFITSKQQNKCTAPGEAWGCVVL